MAAQPPIIFGRPRNNPTPSPTTVAGETGWWAVPNQFYMMVNPNVPSEMLASPNADFSAPVYYCTLADDHQTWAFQDTLLTKYARTG